MTHRTLSGLRVRLIFLVLLAVLPMVALALVNAADGRRREHAALSSQMSQMAELAAATVAQVIEGQRQLLIAMSRLPAVIAQDGAACSAVLADLRAQYQQYTNLGAVTPDGTVFCSAVPQALTTNVADRTYFLRVQATGGFAVGDYQTGRITNLPVVVGAYPVGGAGGPPGLVFAALNLTELSRILAAANLPAGAALVVSDHNDTILARNPDPERWVGQISQDAHDSAAGTVVERVGIDGISRLYAYSPVPGTGAAGLHTSVGLPTEIAYAEITATLIRSLITLLIVFIAALAAAWLGGSAFLLRPIQRLAQASRALAGGDLKTRLGGPYGAGELGRLAEAFDGMAAGLDQRTTQLNHANRMLKMLSECSQAIARAATEPQLLEGVCANLVGQGGYSLAWVRLAGAPLDAPPAACAGGDPAQALALEAAAATRPPTPDNEPLTHTWADLPLAGRPGALQLLITPIWLRDQILGQLCLVSAQPAGFSPDEMQLLEELAGDLAFGLDGLREHTARKTAEAQVRTAAERALALADIGRDLAAVTADYQNCLDLLVRRVAALVGDGALLLLLDESGQWLRPAAAYHPEAAALRRARQALGNDPIPKDAGISGSVITSGRPLISPGPSPEAIRARLPPEAWEAAERLPIRSMLVVPLRAQSRTFGALTLWRDQNAQAYSPEDQLFAGDLADRAALAVSNAQLYAAVHDENTALELRVAERTAALAAENAERRRAEATLVQSAVEIQDLYDNAPCGYHSLDAAGVFVRMNEYELRLLGYTREEVVGVLRFGDVVTAASRERFQQSFPLFRETGRASNLEYELVNRAGRVIPVLISATVVFDSEGRYVMSRSTMLDITDRKQAEEQIQTLNATLRQRAAALEAANRELEAFSYSVSHDLRAPLRSIDGFSLALLEDYGPQLDAEARGYLERVRGAAQRMAALIDDLLSLSRVTRTEMRWATVDLSALAESVVDELRLAQPERAVSVTVQPGLTATGDSRLLRVALVNLLNNAWKFTSKQAHAHIEVGRVAETAEATFFVRDNGAGFDMTYAQRLFGAFQRLHDQAEYAGSGVGLATVQRIFHRHGGRVWGEGRVQGGATFYFSLPAATPEPPAPSPVPDEP
ncbi:MAG: GAF domain-containing protein [Anaerolineales bacterium]|nr:GAF domain-containing protein [Anaerolineales bacterium]